MTSARRPGLILAVLAADVFAALTSEILPVGLLGPIGRDLGSSTAASGLLVTVYAVVVALLSVPLTSVLARLPQRGVVVALVIGYAVINVLFAASPFYWTALVARLLGGVVHAGFFSVVYTAATAVAPKERAGRATAFLSFGTTGGLALGLPIATAVGIASGWRTAAVGLAVVLVALGLLTLLVLPAGHGEAPPGAVSVTRPDRSLLLVGAMIAVLMLGHYSVYTYVSVLAERAGVLPSALGAVLFGYGAASALGVGTAGLLADRRPRASTAVFIVLTAVCAAGVCLSGAAALSTLLIAVWGLVFGALVPLLQTVALHAAPTAPALAPAVVNSSFNTGIAAGAAVGGAELAAAGSGLLAVTAAVLALGSLALLIPRGSGRA